jgi:transposase-like protein
LERIPRQFYTHEFKQEAVSLVLNGGLSAAEVSRQLSISQQTLRNWIKKHKGEGLAALESIPQYFWVLRGHATYFKWLFIVDLKVESLYNWSEDLKI